MRYRALALNPSVGEDYGGLGLNVANTRAVVSDGESSEACVAPGLAPGVLDKPVVLVQVMVVAESHDGHS